MLFVHPLRLSSLRAVQTRFSSETPWCWRAAQGDNYSNSTSRVAFACIFVVAVFPLRLRADMCSRLPESYFMPRRVRFRNATVLSNTWRKHQHLKAVFVYPFCTPIEHLRRRKPASGERVFPQ